VLSASALFFLISGIFSLHQAFNENGKITFINEIHSSAKKFVNISGEVNSPGVYEFSENEIISDLIVKAGGFTENADSEFIARELNLAEKPKDGMKIFIPSINTSNRTTLININTASLELLDSLPGIGASTAEKIISNRPYYINEDIMVVDGMTESKYEAIKELITTY
jgi:competence protein ComEA